MRWFRLHQRWGTCFALAALLIQLVVASGHIHLDFAGHDHSYPATHTEPHGGDAAISASAHEPDAPDDHHAPPHDRCAACTLIQLAQSLLAPAVPALVLPGRFAREPASHHAAAPTAPHAARFRARAPPAA